MLATLRRAVEATWNEYGWVVVGCIVAGLITSTITYSHTHSFVKAAAVGDITDAVCYWGWAARDALRDIRQQLPHILKSAWYVQLGWAFWNMVRVNLVAEIIDLLVRPGTISYWLSQAGEHSLLLRSAAYVLAILLADVVFFSIRAISKQTSRRLSAWLETQIITLHSRHHLGRFVARTSVGILGVAILLGASWYALQPLFARPPMLAATLLWLGYAGLATPIYATCERAMLRLWQNHGLSDHQVIARQIPVALTGVVATIGLFVAYAFSIGSAPPWSSAANAAHTLEAILFSLVAYYLWSLVAVGELRLNQKPVNERARP